MANSRHLCRNWAQPLTKRAKDGTMLSIKARGDPASPGRSGEALLNRSREVGKAA